MKRKIPRLLRLIKAQSLLRNITQKRLESVRSDILVNTKEQTDLQASYGALGVLAVVATIGMSRRMAVLAAERRLLLSRQSDLWARLVRNRGALDRLTAQLATARAEEEWHALDDLLDDSAAHQLAVRPVG